MQARNDQLIHLGDLYFRRWKLQCAVRLHQLRYRLSPHLVLRNPCESAVGVIEAPLSIIVGKYRLLLEHDKRQVVEYWNQQVEKMYKQSKGKT